MQDGYENQLRLSPKLTFNTLYKSNDKKTDFKPPHEDSSGTAVIGLTQNSIIKLSSLK